MKSKKTAGNQPVGRNGHTATLISKFEILTSACVGNRLFIIGGWLGQGPLAASDLHILDLDTFKWLPNQTTGDSPGPCNMHTADGYKSLIYVFRGGDGRDYLNDLHELNTEQLKWSKVSANGTPPPPRANHSSSVVNQSLFIFGGWDGSKRLNDFYAFDLENRNWSHIIV